MDSLVTFGLKTGDFYFLSVTALVSATASLAVFSGCFYWFKQEHRRMQHRLLSAISAANRRPEDLILTGREPLISGELVARVIHGRHVVSVLESDGRRYIHVNGDLSPIERSRVVHYLRSEGFMS